MKTIKLFFLITLTSLLFASCNQEAIRPTIDPDLIGTVGAAWSSEVMDIEMIPADNNTITVEMYRSVTGAAATVPIEIKAVDKDTPVPTEFTVPANAEFEAGSAVTNIVISYTDINALDPTKKYQFRLAITDSTFLSQSLVAEIKVGAQRRITWKDFAKGTYTCPVFTKPWEAVVQRAEEAPNMFQIVDCWGKESVDWWFATGSSNTILSAEGTIDKYGTYPFYTGVLHVDVPGTEIWADFAPTAVKADSKFFLTVGTKSCFVRYYHVPTVGAFEWKNDTFVISELL